MVDTGFGIEPSDLERLFEPFTQADTSAKRVYGGTGLGLTICRRLSLALGGALTATSVPGEGSRFTLKIPVGDMHGVVCRELPTGGAALALSDPSSAPDVEVLEGRHILVVDDRRELRSLMQMLLEDAGAKVSLAAHGGEALAAFDAADHGIEAVLMDMQMPVMDGYTAVRAMRERGITVPVVAVTAHALRGEQDACIGAGCDAYTTKPLDGDALLAILTEQIERKRSRA